MVEDNSIYNEATDNASAVSWMLEIACGMTIGEQPDHSVLFLAFTCEESGLLGRARVVLFKFHCSR